MLMSVIMRKEERPKGAAVEGAGVGRKQNESEESEKQTACTKGNDK